MSDVQPAQPGVAEFAAEGLVLRETTRAARVRRAVWNFVLHRPLGATGVFIVLVWSVIAVGTIGGGGGWLGIGRYNSLDVFKTASTTFADAKAADLLDGVSADASRDDLLALFQDSAFLGPLADSAGVTEDLHAYVLGRVRDGTLVDHLLTMDPAELERRDGVLVNTDDLFATGTEAPIRTASLEEPSGKHWLGTDRAGQDLFARVTEGSRLSMTIGFFAAGVATLIGTLIGLASGFLGGKFDLLGNRIMDALQAFPGLVFLLLLASVTRGGSIVWTVLALAVLGFAPIQRIVRGSVIAESQTQYVEAARTLGASNARIMLRHILPNILAPVIVVFSITIGAYILVEAALSFLGLGPTQVSWGKMVSDGRQFIVQSPWTSLWAGLALTSLVFGFNIAGDALRDILDPRLRGSR